MGVVFALMQIFLGVLVLLMLAAILTYPVSIPILAYYLSGLRILVCPVEEQTVRWIERGGKAWRCITPGHDEDPVPIFFGIQETWPMPLERRPTDAKLISAEGDEPRIIDLIDRLLPGGIRWFGFRMLGYHIKRYNFRWSVLRENEPLDTEDSIVGKRKLPSGRWMAVFAKVLDYVYLRDAVYGCEINGAETSELMAVDIILAITMQVVDPYLPIFQVHDWMETILDLIRPIVRIWVKQHTYEQVVAKREAAGRQAGDLILDFTGLTDAQLAELAPERPRPRTIAEYIEERYGVKILGLAFEEIIPPKGYAEAATLRVASLQNKFTTITNAEAELEREKLLGQAEAERLAAVLTVVQGNPDALIIRKLEVLEEVGKNGNMVVLSGENSQLLLPLQQKPLLINPPEGSSNKKQKGGDE